MNYGRGYNPNQSAPSYQAAPRASHGRNSDWRKNMPTYPLKPVRPTSPSKYEVKSSKKAKRESVQGLRGPQFAKTDFYANQLEQEHVIKDTWTKVVGGEDHLRERQSNDMRYSKIRLSEAEHLMVITDRQKKKSAKKTKEIQQKVISEYHFDKVARPKETEWAQGPYHGAERSTARKVVDRMSMTGRDLYDQIQGQMQVNHQGKKEILMITIVMMFGMMAYFMANNEAFSTFLEKSLVEMDLVRSPSWFDSSPWTDRMEYPMAMTFGGIVAFLGPMALVLMLVM